MKRMWIGIGVLLAILLVGILVTAVFARLHYPMAQSMARAGEMALAGDWDAALRLSADTQKAWERCRRFTAALADHEPIEEVECLFSQLAAWGRMRDTGSYAAVCAALSQQLQAIGDSQQLPWWSLL